MSNDHCRRPSHHDHTSSRPQGVEEEDDAVQGAFGVVFAPNKQDEQGEFGGLAGGCILGVRRARSACLGCLVWCLVKMSSSSKHNTGERTERDADLYEQFGYVLSVADDIDGDKDQLEADVETFKRMSVCFCDLC